jgi:hypothetical protein
MEVGSCSAEGHNEISTLQLCAANISKMSKTRLGSKHIKGY